MNTHTPQPRATVAAIPAYVPGRPPVPRPGITPYKLSSNENPYPPLPGVLDAVRAAAETMNRYPDMGAVQMYDALAARLGVHPGQLAAGTGSVATLYQLLQAFCEPGDEVVHAWRSFEAYPIAIAVAGAASVPVPLTPDARHDLDAMAAAVTDRTKVVLLCTPNNPTGPSIRHQELVAFLERVPSHVLVVVDEAYREFVRDEDPADPLALLPQHENLALLRTFAKAYGLAGLRVGYLVAHEPVAAAVRACSLPFGVTSIAQAAVVASLQQEPALLERVAAIVEQRELLTTALADQGWQLPEAQGNFVWLPTGGRTAEVVAAAAEAGLSLRPFGDEGIRVSIGEPAANDVLVRVLSGFAPR